MGRVQMTGVTALLLVVAPGCAGSKLWKRSSEPQPAIPEGVPTAPLSSLARYEPNPVVPASATSVSKLFKPPRVPATEMTLLWRNRIDYLPDPARNGQMGPGLVGQLFLFGPNLQFVEANGKLVVALYDETPHPPGVEPLLPEGWEFTKETLQKLKTADERFGMSYALFLPWPTYRPDVSRIRIAARYEQENGHTLYAPETRITLDNSVPGGAGHKMWSSQPYLPAGLQSGMPALPPVGPPSPVGPPTVSGPGGSPLASPPAALSAPPGGMPGGVMPSPILAPPPTVGGLPYGALAPAPPDYGRPAVPLPVPTGPGAVPSSPSVVSPPPGVAPSSLPLVPPVSSPPSGAPSSLPIYP